MKEEIYLPCARCRTLFGRVYVPPGVIHKKHFKVEKCSSCSEKNCRMHSKKCSACKKRFCLKCVIDCSCKDCSNSFCLNSECYSVCNHCRRRVCNSCIHFVDGKYVMCKDCVRDP